MRIAAPALRLLCFRGSQEIGESWGVDQLVGQGFLMPRFGGSSPFTPTLALVEWLKTSACGAENMGSNPIHQPRLDGGIGIHSGFRLRASGFESWSGHKD